MIEIKIISDLEEAKKLWNLLSPKETIYDLWDFRYCFYKYENYRLEFITAFDIDSPVALLPLQYNKKDNCYEYFAEEFMEESRPFIKEGYEYLIPELYQKVKSVAKLYDISANNGTDEFTSKLELEDYKYFLPLIDYANFSTFLSDRLNAKRRRSLIKEIGEIEDKSIDVEIIKASDNINDAEIDKNMDLLFNYNFSSFAEESYLLKNSEREAHRDLLRLNFDWRLVIVSVNNQKEALAFSILYKNTWYYLVTGVNFKSIPGLGKYMVKINLEEAIKNKYKFFDIGLGDCGWKHLWHFDKKPQYLFIKE